MTITRKEMAELVSKMCDGYCFEQGEAEQICKLALRGLASEGLVEALGYCSEIGRHGGVNQYPQIHNVADLALAKYREAVGE